jgi:hypothetical protein
LAIENCDIIHELTRIIAKHENTAWQRNPTRARCLRSIIRIPKAWEKPLIKYLVHLIIFQHSFHLIFIDFEKIKPRPGISKNKKRKRWAPTTTRFIQAEHHYYWRDSGYDAFSVQESEI